MSMYEVKRDFISQYVILCAVILLWVTDSGATQVQQWDSLNTLELTSEGVSDLDQSTTILEDQSVCMNGGQGRTSWLLWFFFERWTSKSTYGFPLKEGQPTNFNFKLSHAPTTDVTVTITDESIYPAKLEFSKKTLTFTTTNWCQSQNVTIKFMDNDTVDDYENKRARASFSLQGEGVRTDGYTIDYVDLIDEEREKAFIKVRPNVLKMKEGEKKPYYIKLGTPPSGTVTIKIPDIEENYHLIHDKDELIFNKGSWDTEQEVMVTSARDDNWNFSVVSYPLTAEGSGYDDVKTNVIVEIKDIDKPLTAANIRGLPKKINTKDVLTAQFNFARDVTGFETDDITVTGGTKGATLSGSGDSYTLPITPNGSENVVVAISKNAATDGVVNGPAKRVTKTAVWDANAPTITISGIPGKINSTNNLTATFTFSVPVTDFEINDIIVQGGKKDIFTEVSSTVYTLVITPIGNANVVVTVKKNAASDGINLGPKVPVKVMAIWDSVAPTLDITGLPGKINTTADLTATFTFSESVTGFESNDITVDGGTKKDFDGSGKSYTLVITPSRGQDIKVTVPANAATDGLNEGPPRDVYTFVTWHERPNVIITGIPESINSTDPLTATFKFGEDVMGFNSDDVVVNEDEGTKGTFTQVSPSEYTLVVTPKEGKSLHVTVPEDAAIDADGFKGPVGPVTAMAIWDADPDVAISGLPEKIYSTEPLTVIFTFTEYVTGFTTEGVTVAEGTKGVFGGSGSRYTLIVTPINGKDLTLTVKANAATDGLNTGPPKDVTKTAIWDDPPDVVITGIPEIINSTDPLTATFTFTEDVTGFGTGDLNYSGLTKGDFTEVSSSEYTLVVTPKDGEDLLVEVPVHVATDTDGIQTGPIQSRAAGAIWDATAPDVMITGLPDKINSTEPLTATFTFTEEVTGFEADDVTVSEGTKGAFDGSGMRYTLVLTPESGKDLTVTVAADAATDGLNMGPTDAVSVTVTWDDNAPNVIILGLPDKINSTSDLTATFTFNEKVTGFEADDVTVSEGTKGAFAGIGTNYTLVLTPTSGEDLTVIVAADAATDGLNTGPTSPVSHMVIWDATAPDVTITELPDKINSTEPLTAIFTFTEDVTGFTTEDVTVSGATKDAFTASSATTYTLGIQPLGTGDVTVTVARDAASDGVNTGPTDAVSATVTWDDNAPNVIILGLPDKINSTSDLTATFTFNEKVTGFEADDVTVSEGTKGAFAGIGTNYTLVLTPTSGEDLTVIVAADAATDGLNTGPTSPVSHMVIWDATAPDVTITELPDKINSTEPLTAIFTFTEDVTGFTTEDVTVSGATKDAFTASSATTYTLGIQPLGTGDVTVTVARDAASDGVNTGPTDAVSATVTWDGATPGVTISDVPEKINSRTTFMTTFTFSEEVTGFIVDDVMVSGATKGASWSAHTETVYTLSVTPSGDQDVVVTVPPNVATDGTNTGPTTAVSATAIWDNSVPTVTITGLPQRITTVAPLTVTFIFSEEVTGFVAEDIEVTAATKGSFTGTQKRYTLVVTPTGISDVVVTVNADVVTDGLNTGPPNKVTAKAIWDPERIVTLTASSNQVQEGQSVRVNVNLTGAPFASNIPIPLRYPRLLAGAATEPADYTQLRSITIEAGKNIGSGIIATRDDDVYEGDELFEVAFGDLPDGLTRGNPDSQTITIEDRTIRPTATLSAEDVSEGEEVTVTVTLSRSMLRAVTIPLTLIQGTATASEDYQIPRSLSVTIAAGKTQANLGISTLEDQRIEEAETFTIAFGDLPSTVQGSNAIVVTIIEDTKPELLTVSSIAIVEGGSNTLQVSLSATPSASVTVTMHGFSAPLNVPSPPRLIFTPQDWDQPQDVELTADMDPNITNEERTLILTANGGGYVAITKQLLITITDKDVAQLVVQSFLNVPEGGTSMLNISLASAPVSLTTVTLEGNQHSTLTIAPPPLTFSTMDWNQSRMLTFQAAEDDNFVSESQALTIRAMGYTDQDVTSSLRVTMEDNDQPELKVTATTLLIQEGGTGEFQVVLNGEPSSDVVLSFSGYTGLRPVQSLTFTPADWGTQKTVILEALEDENDFEDEAFDLTLMANGGEFNGLSKKVSITIEDDDVPLQAVILSINDKRVREDEKKLQLEVELSRATDEVVTVQYESSDLTAEAGADYTASRGFVIFDPQTTRGVIQFDIHDDENPEGEETFEVTLSNPKNAILGRATATATILDPNSVSIVRIEDAVTEGDAMHFAVHIFPPSSKPITVHYQTEDGTAKAGEDYQATSGILEITPAEETMMIQVPLLVQEVTANPETFTVRLNTSEPIELEKAVATAIITEDVLPAVDTSEIMNAYTARFIRTAASEIVEGVGHRLKNQSSTCSAASRHETARLWHSAWTPPLSELLSGCHMTSTHGSVQVWGRGAYRRFHGQEEGDGLQVEANVSTAMAGGDYRWRSGWLTGVLVSHSRSDGAYQFYDVRDEIDASMTGIYPYLSYQTKTWGIWGTGGISRGRTEIMFRIDPTLGNIGIPLGQTTIRNVQRLERSWLAGFGAIGVQGVMAMVNALRLRYYGDVMIISTELDDQRVGVVRIRAGMEASAPLTTGLHPYVEAGVRQDAGSAENGVGLELGAGMRVAIPALRLRGDLRTQSLMVHSAEGFTEWGISGSLEFGNQHKGFGLRVTPSLGPSHRRGIYTQQTIRDATATQDGIYRTEMEFGYGIPFQETVIRSVMGVTSFDRGRIYRLGGELRSWGSFSVSAFGMVHTHQNASRNLGINLQAALDD